MIPGASTCPTRPPGDGRRRQPRPTPGLASFLAEVLRRGGHLRKAGNLEGSRETWAWDSLWREQPRFLTISSRTVIGRPALPFVLRQWKHLLQRHLPLAAADAD